ncbi:MAG: hypothetical protein AB3N24_18650 [Leisingera sp.]
MRRLMTKFWKVIAYFVGLFGLGFVQVAGLDVETFGVLYTGAGMAWLVVWLLRNNDSEGTALGSIPDDREDAIRHRSEQAHRDYLRNGYYS